MTQLSQDGKKTAGVTVWIGDRSITREVPLHVLSLTQDRLALEFADANADLRDELWSQNRQP
jgi:hypothetical protein